MENNDNIWIRTPPLDSSWYWKKVNTLKAEMQGWYFIWCLLAHSCGEVLTHTELQYTIGANARLKECLT